MTANAPAAPPSEVDAIPPHARLLLERLTRLRVVTAPQAHLLTPDFAKRSLRNAYHRLATLVRHRWLVMDAVAPSRGAATAHYYRLGYRALRPLGVEKRVTLLQRPAQHVLEYLLFAAEVYARAIAAGWYVGSPAFLAPKNHAAALARFCEFLKRRALERLKAAEARHAPPAELLEARRSAEQLPKFLPQQLNFEFLYRLDARGQTDTIVLLLVDDVRRSVASQVAALPLVARADCGLLVRDNDSVWDAQTQALAFAGPRLPELRRAVAARFGEAFLSTDTEFAQLWARTARPVQPGAPRAALRSPTITASKGQS